MSDPTAITDVQTEERIGFTLIREKVISESQLKTALDFQRAIGGAIEDVIVRLQFVDGVIMKRLSKKLKLREPGVPKTSVSKKPAAQIPHTSIILDVLLRLLIRKGVIDSEELKEELKSADPLSSP